MRKFLIPIAVFALLGVLLWVGLSLNPRTIPSPLVGKPLPSFSLTTLHEPKRMVTADSLRGRVYLLNVWASWCVACRQEHPVLKSIAQQKVVPLIGLNYKDKREDALAWLGEFENPYYVSVVDADGRLGIELGVYGVPETFVIDKAGVIRYKHIGPVTEEAWIKTLLPLIQQLST
ncbi:MAG TPA: DsbE family thiol:disulfide interchange protein [Burkholderiales bacterium]|nr:DsbE family thiol:disulfide interchange protein [Burkholderiales bacterium]